jgi:predicted HTH domain antitoxin
MRTVELPEELLALLEGSRLGDRPEADRVKVALAVHLFQEGVISLGKAAELSGEPRFAFESLLIQLGIDSAIYDAADYGTDSQTIARLKQRRSQP